MKVENKKQLENLSNQSNSFMKVSVGETPIRVMSHIECVREHNIKVEGKNRAIACPTETKRMEIASGVSQDNDVPACPLCELGYPVKTSYLAMVIEREREEYNKKGEKQTVGGDAWILKKGPTLFSPIQNLLDDSNWGREYDYDINLIATGEGFDRKYNVVAIPKENSKPITDKENISLNLLKEKVDLQKMTTPRPYAEIKEIIGDMPDYETTRALEGEAF